MATPLETYGFFFVDGIARSVKSTSPPQGAGDAIYRISGPDGTAMQRTQASSMRRSNSTSSAI